MGAKNAINKLAACWGYQINSIEHLRKLARSSGADNFLERRSLLIKSREIDFLLDVGANEGQFAKSMRARGFLGRIVSFEPLSAAFLRLQSAAAEDPLWQCEGYALGDTDGFANINISENSVSSSLLPIREACLAGAPSARYVSAERITIKTLDGVSSRLVPKNARAYLKLDAQGYEKRILEGGRSTLKHIALIQLEASLCSLYEGDSTICELVNWLDASGFEPVSIEPGFWDESTGRQFQVDVLFWRKNEMLPAAD